MCIISVCCFIFQFVLFRSSHCRLSLSSSSDHMHLPSLVFVSCFLGHFYLFLPGNSITITLLPTWCSSVLMTCPCYLSIDSLNFTSILSASTVFLIRLFLALFLKVSILAKSSMQGETVQFYPDDGHFIVWPKAWSFYNNF